MVRHDVSKEVTAEIVAQLHQEDLKVQEEFNCRGLTYWYDDQKLNSLLSFGSSKCGGCS